MAPPPLRRLLDRREVAGRVAAALAVAAAITLTYRRLYYGVDFTDESFYVAVPYRLLLGARPFVDETTVTQQTAALLVYPFLRAYHAAAGLTGIVLFVRHLQFALSLLVAAAAVVSLRGLLGTPRAALIATAAVVFAPFDIHSLSYNTLACGLFTAGCLLGFHASMQPGRQAAAGGALSLGLAAFAYPPLLGAVAVAGCSWLALAGRRRRRAAGLALTALLLPLAGFAALLLSAGPHRIAVDYRNSSRYLGQGGGVGKLADAAAHQLSTFRFWYLAVLALGLAAVAWRRARVGAGLLLVVLPLVAWPPKPDFYTASLEFVAHYGWLALPLYPLVRRRAGAGGLLVAVWVPALAAGATTAYSSANGGVNFGVGFFAAALVSGTFLAWSLEQTQLPRWTSALPSLLVLGLLLSFSSPVYRDGPLSSLRARVHGGAYAGLLTSPRKRAFVTDLRRDLAAAGAADGCRILFFNDFPAGYLLTRARPDTNGAWTASVSRADVRSYQEGLLAYYRRGRFPQIAVVLRRIPYAPPTSARIEHYGAGEPLLAALRARRFRVAADRLDYRVLRAPPGCRRVS